MLEHVCKKTGWGFKRPTIPTYSFKAIFKKEKN